MQAYDVVVQKFSGVCGLRRFRFADVNVTVPSSSADYTIPAAGLVQGITLQGSLALVAIVLRECRCGMSVVQLPIWWVRIKPAE